jgi:hypothetical protein
MTTMTKMIELALKVRHECYQFLTPKYPAQDYYFQKIIRFGEILKAERVEHMKAM